MAFYSVPFNPAYALRVAVTPEQFGAGGSGANDTTALTLLAAYVNSATTPIHVIINDTHRTTKTIEFTLEDLLISGFGKVIKGGAISTTDESSTDTQSASSVITVAGARSTIKDITITDEDEIDGEANGYGRAGLALTASDVLCENVKLQSFVSGIQVGWAEPLGFSDAWTGTEIRNVRILSCSVTNCRPHHDNDNTIFGAGIRSFGSNTVINNCYIQASDTHAADQALLHGIKIEGLPARHTTGTNLNDDGGYVTNNLVKGPFQHSIYVESVKGVVVSHNKVENTGREPITVQGEGSIISHNIIAIGRYSTDSNPPVGIRIKNGKNWVIDTNVLYPWGTSEESDVIGIYIEDKAGNGKISNNLITRNSAPINTYGIESESGTINTSYYVSSASSDTAYRLVNAYVTGESVSLTQGNGWFEVGQTISQPSGDWSATITSWIDPVNATITKGIFCEGVRVDIVGNTIAAGVVTSKGIDLNGATNIVVDGNGLYGISGTSVIQWQNYVGDVICRNNRIDGNAALQGLYLYTFTSAAAVADVSFNVLTDNAKAFRVGSGNIPSPFRIGYNLLNNNTSNAQNDRSATGVTWVANEGYTP